MAVKRKSQKPQRQQIALSDRTKKILLGSSGGVLVVVASFWAYYTFTTVPPPKLDKATAADVASFLGNERGISRLNYDNREKFLADMWAKFGDGDKREQLAAAFDKMTPAQRDVFINASFDLAKDRFLKQATTFQDLPPHKRTEFVDNMINQIETQRLSIGGAGPRSGKSNLAKAFESAVPNTTDGMTKVLIDRTNARQRAKAQPLFDAITVRYKERQDQRRN